LRSAPVRLSPDQVTFGALAAIGLFAAIRPDPRPIRPCEQRAQLVFTDPPYNVPIAGHVGGLALQLFF